MGNTMAIYEKTGTGSLVLKVQELYGSSRLGTYQRNVEVENLGGEGSYIWGSRFFELSNHLGNVLATIQDRMTVNHSSGVDYYDPVVVSAQDYYAFGIMMPGRTYSAPGGAYRYGFNGKENDNEVKGMGNQQDYGMRIYDPRLGRFLSVDPLTKGYPMLTPFQFASNRPIDGIDLDGLEYLQYNIVINYHTGKVMMAKPVWFDPNQHNSHGDLGKGVMYKIILYDEKLRLNRNIQFEFVSRNATADPFGFFKAEHGLYMGATSLYKLNKKGNFTDKYDY